MAAQTNGPIELAIREKLTSLLHPSSLVIRNDSWQHRHHTAMRDNPISSDAPLETHFAIEVVSDAFAGKMTMQRHRIIYAALKAELDAGLHSLSLKTKTEAEAGGDPSA
ncbi:bola-like protein [Cylindrobasidium torrendii FP15055 ss-10]|uniref:Bola-like protein n=1 Tax=Cylindrobasidium torrendii FP15055 ss-10 TaxID=1314674 RepID=A0A0D7BVD5_9AGAR|nr:bola-like protein [Cylindrobasidium torrendii FP15055 ss-10]